MSLPRTNKDTRTARLVIADDAPLRTRVQYSRAVSDVAANRSGDRAVGNTGAVPAIDLIVAAVDRPDLLRRVQAGDPVPSLQK